MSPQSIVDRHITCMIYHIEYERATMEGGASRFEGVNSRETLALASIAVAHMSRVVASDLPLKEVSDELYPRDSMPCLAGSGASFVYCNRRKNQLL